MASIELRKFLVGTVVWGIGNQMVTVTQTYVIFDITQSALQLAILGAAVVIASVSMSLASGILADRFSRKTLLMCGSVMTATSMLMIGLLLLTDRVEPWHIQVAGAIHGAALALDWTARFSLLPIMVPRNILARSVFFDNSFFNLGRVLAPLLWGAIVHWWGYDWSYVVIAGMMALNFVIVATYRPLSSSIPTAHQAIWHDVVEIATVVRTNSILTGNLTFTFVNALLMGGFIYLLTPIAREVYNVGTWWIQPTVCRSRSRRVRRRFASRLYRWFQAHWLRVARDKHIHRRFRGRVRTSCQSLLRLRVCSAVRTNQRDTHWVGYYLIADGDHRQRAGQIGGGL